MTAPSELESIPSEELTTNGANSGVDQPEGAVEPEQVETESTSEQVGAETIHQDEVTEETPDLAHETVSETVDGVRKTTSTETDDIEKTDWIEVKEEGIIADEEDDEENDIAPDDVEMSLFDHLEELRQRIFYSLIAVAISIAGCFAFVKPLVKFLEEPAGEVKFLQLSPGEFFFVSFKVAAYSGLLLASPFLLYQIIQFVLPGLTRRERKFLGPVVFGSSFLFVGGLAFAYWILIPAALNFFISYGADVVEQLWSIDRYFEFVLLLMFSVGLAFQIPIIQALLGFLGIVTSKQMLGAWRLVLLGAAVLGAVLTPSTDPLTQCLLAGAVLGLYMGGIGLVKLLGR